MNDEKYVPGSPFIRIVALLSLVTAANGTVSMAPPLGTFRPLPAPAPNSVVPPSRWQAAEEKLPVPAQKPASSLPVAAPTQVTPSTPGPNARIERRLPADEAESRFLESNGRIQFLGGRTLDEIEDAGRERSRQAYFRALAARHVLDERSHRSSVRPIPDSEVLRKERTFDASQPYGQRFTDRLYLRDGTVEIRQHSPLIFDLRGAGSLMSSENALFDVEGSGKVVIVHDLGRGIGMLVFDPDGDGVPGRNGRGLFGDHTDVYGRGQPGRFADGFEAFDALVRRAVDEGALEHRVLDEGVLRSGDLALLEDRYGLRMKIGGLNGEAVSLREAGIAAIFLSRSPSIRSRDFDGQGDDLLRRDGAAFLRNDGTKGFYGDVWLLPSANSAWTSPQLQQKISALQAESQ